MKNHSSHNSKANFDALKAEYEIYSSDLSTVMRKNIFKVFTSTTVSNAMNIFKLNKTNILPVADHKNKPVGILKKNEFFLKAERVIQKDPANGSALLNSLTVEAFMEYSFIIVPPEYSVGDLADLFKQTSENFAVVMINDKLVGTVREADIHDYLKSNLSRQFIGMAG